MSLDLDNILTQYNIKYERISEYYKVLCPFHAESGPSGHIHHKSYTFHCFGCNKRTSFYAFLVRATNETLEQIKIKFGVRSDCRKPISSAEIEQYHIALWTCDEFLKELRYRMITDEIIRERRLGMIDWGHEKRIVIPIKNDVGEYVNMRMYLPGAKERKFLNLRGEDHKKTRFTPLEQFEYDEILVCGGELKAYLAASILNKYDIGAVAPTTSEVANWPSENNYRFTGKLTHICSDVDEAGKKSMEFRCRVLKNFARELHKIELPLDLSKYPTGDINDFIREGGDLYKLIRESKEWIYIPGGEITEEIAEPVSFREAFNQKNVEKKISFPCIISGYNQTHYFVPSIVDVKCTKDKDYCPACDISQMPTIPASMPINPEHRVLLALVSEKETNHPFIYKECFHIPKQCQVCTFTRKEEYSIHEVCLEEQMEATSRSEPTPAKLGYVVNGPPVPENQAYLLTGRLYPSPKNQQSTFLASKCEPTLDALDSYVPAQNEDSLLQIFTPQVWTLESLEEKLNDIYCDLEANITKRYRRRDMHIAYDLAYHSLLHFDFIENSSIKACVELLVVGDTSEGKSTTFEALQKHYSLGFKVDCGNISKAGITIGIDRVGNKKFTVYGVLPKNDKGLVAFDEFSKMHEDDWRSLTEVRSSGLVQITKIEQKFRKARVRLIVISNPREEGREISSYSYGVESAISLIGTNQDLRRFDFVLIVGKNDNPDGIPEIQYSPRYSHKYTGELCQKLILRAWKCDAVNFQNIPFIMETTARLIEKFGNGPPILDNNSSHLKIARLSASIAARTNSYHNDTLQVRNCHVEFIEKYLNRIYSSPSCKLHEKSKAIRDAVVLRNIDHVIDHLKKQTNVEHIVQKLIESDSMSANYMRDIIGDPFIAATLLSKLIQSNAIYRIRNDKYVKNPEFTNILKNCMAKGEFTPKLPPYLDKEKF